MREGREKTMNAWKRERDGEKGEEGSFPRANEGELQSVTSR